MAVNAVTDLIAVVVVLGLMILVHEWGHFMAAKYFGVCVDIFSFGFGPRLLGRRRGPTDYRLSALPLGGYVKMAGDNPAEERTGQPDEFLSKPRWQRAVIAVAGPMMNVLMAVALLAGTFALVGVPYPAYLSRPVEVLAFPKKSLGASAGIRSGDRLAEIDNLKNPTWEQARQHLLEAKPGAEIRLLFDRGGELVPFMLNAPDTREVDSILGFPPIPAIVEQVAPGMPAERAGLRADDELVALNGQPLATWSQFVETIRQSNGQPMDVTVRRGDRQLHLRIKPVQVQVGRGETVWQIGTLPRPEVTYRRLSFPQAVAQGVLTSAGATRQIVGVVGHLILGRVSLSQVQGVIGIARETGSAARRGPVDVINLMAVLSLNLAILNLLPIPILDGGHILFLAIEGGLRRDLSLAVKERFVQVGLVFLLAVIAFVMYNDVLRLLPGH
jgi:regulator of sigma E protease